MTPAPERSRIAAGWRAEPGRPTWAIVLCDAVRLAALVSLVVAGALYGGTAVALFLLVLGGTMIPRTLAVPTALDAAFGVTVLGAAWCAQLGVYQRVPWLDLVVHAAATGVMAALAHRLLVRTGAASGARTKTDAGDRAVRRPRLAAAVTTLGVGALLAVVWELLEAVGHTSVDREIYVTYTDTIGDLAAALAGSAVAAALVARGVGRDREP